MLNFMAFRLAQAFVSLFAVATIMFFITQVVGDPVNVLVPPGTTIEHRDRVRHDLGLTRPILVQYADYMSGLAVGDLGDSYRSRRPVSEIIAQRLPATLELGLAALVITIGVGIPLGLFSGYWRGGWLDQGARTFAVLGQSAPSFWIGILLIYAVAVHLRWLPTGGRGGFAHLVLPAITMAWSSLAGVVRLMRSSVLETLETDFIKFSRMQGLSERRVLWNHAFRNSLLPVLTFGGVLSANIMVGSVVTESVFVWPGMGRLMTEAADARDYPVVQGVALVLATVYIFMALTIDVLYVYLNPRLRSEQTQ